MECFLCEVWERVEFISVIIYTVLGKKYQISITFRLC